MKCIVKDCKNHEHEGLFIGSLCLPCHTYITKSEGTYSQAYRNSKREWQGLTDDDEIPWDGVDAKSFARAIEAKLKEKNHDQR